MWMIVWMACSVTDDAREEGIAPVEVMAEPVDDGEVTPAKPWSPPPLSADEEAERAAVREKRARLRQKASDETWGCTAEDGGTFILPRRSISELVELELEHGGARGSMHRGPDGEPDGFKLSGLWLGSPADRCGFKILDIVHSVNGMPLTSMEEVLSAYEAIKAAGSTDVTFTLSRRGAPRQELVLRAPKD